MGAVFVVDTLGSMRDTLLITLATLRLNRFVIADAAGEWLLVRPAQRWAARHEATTADGDTAPNPADGWRSKLVSGLDCPFCVGFWLGAGVLASYHVARRTGTMKAWRAAAGAFALSYVTGHINNHMD